MYEKCLVNLIMIHCTVSKFSTSKGQRSKWESGIRTRWDSSTRGVPYTFNPLHFRLRYESLPFAFVLLHDELSGGRRARRWSEKINKYERVREDSSWWAAGEGVEENYRPLRKLKVGRKKNEIRGANKFILQLFLLVVFLFVIYILFIFRFSSGLDVFNCSTPSILIPVSFPCRKLHWTEILICLMKIINSSIFIIRACQYYTCQCTNRSYLFNMRKH